MIKVNAIGDTCPIPVVKTENAIKELAGAGEVEVLVDNEIAVQNLGKMAQQKGYGFKSEKLGAAEFQVTITVVFVTHDQEEAMMISDRIVVMSKGHIEQDGSPKEIYNNPATRFVAGFIGEMNFLDNGDGTETGVRPENVTITADLDADGVKGTVRTIMMLGHYQEITCDTAYGLVKANVSSEQAATFAPGQQVTLQFSKTYTFQKEED